MIFLSADPSGSALILSSHGRALRVPRSCVRSVLHFDAPPMPARSSGGDEDDDDVERLVEAVADVDDEAEVEKVIAALVQPSPSPGA